MKIVAVLLFVYSLLAFESPLSISSENLTWNVDVQVATRSDKSLIESFIKRELRSLGDVKISPTNTDFTLRIIHIKEKTTQGLSIGHAVSVVGTSYNKKTVFHVLYVGDTSSLKVLCQNTVADFDSDVLERCRQQWGIINRKEEK